MAHYPRRALFALGGLLIAGAVALLLVRSAPDPPPHETPVVRSVPEAAPEPSSVPAAETPPPQLPLTLLGTVAGSEPSLSRATLRREGSQETLVVGVGDVIDGRALVVRIERERVLLRENGAIRELQIAGDRLSDSDRAFEARIANLENAIQGLTLDQVHVIPEVEASHLVGLRVSAVQDGSRFAQLRIQDGDVITQFNGASIDSPSLALRAVWEMLNKDGYHVMIRRRDGSMSQLNYKISGAGDSQASQPDAPSAS